MKENISKLQDYSSMIQDDRIRSFTVDGLDQTDDFSDEVIAYSKRVFAITREICQLIDADDYILDIFASASLLSQCMRYKKEDDMVDIFYALRVRPELSGLQAELGAEVYNDIMMLIEGQQGLNAPLPQVQPKPDAVVHMWIMPIAIRLAAVGR